MNTKIIKAIVAILGLSVVCVAFKYSPEQEHTSNVIDEKVNELISQMTIEEKVGQMTQVTIDLILDDNSTASIDEKKLTDVIVNKNIGSILNVKGHAYSLKTWHNILDAIQKKVAEGTRQKIPVLYGIDAIHGNNYTVGSTLFPHNIGMAATRNDKLVKNSTNITAMETRATGIRWNFDPVLGLGRQPLWSRFEETYGEDVYLASSMGRNAIEGYQGSSLEETTAVAACMKHFIAYSVPSSGKDRTPSYVPENVIREYFLPPFQAAVDANVASVMINSGELNGTPLHGSHYYLTQVLRDELGFEGVAVSDWEDIIRLHTRHRIASSPKEAVKLAIEAGVDMSMVPYDFSFYDLLIELVEEGTIPEKRIDLSVKRILKMKHRLGLFDNAYPEKEAIAKFGSLEYKETSLQAAMESMTLLKNEENILPIAKTSKILLAGPSANDITSLHGSWSYTWQGVDDQYYPKTDLTIKQTLENELGSENVICRSSRSYNDKSNTNVEKLLADAKDVDYIILCLGEKSYAESPGVIDDLMLENDQLKLAEAAISTGKPVILVLLEGRPRIIAPIEKDIKGILMAYRPASNGAEAIVKTLFGENNPSGKLPFTYPRHTGDIVLYDHKYTERIREDIPNQAGNEGFQPQWPFGHGLSYTSFSFKNMTVSKSRFKSEDQVTVKVNVTNSGKLDGSVAIELYSRDLYASITPNFKRLKKYKKINLKKGESRDVTFVIDAEDLSFINAQNKRVTEKGTFELMIGKETVKIEFEG